MHLTHFFPAILTDNSISGLFRVPVRIKKEKGYYYAFGLRREREVGKGKIMPVYMIIEAKEIMDRAKYGEYIEKVPRTIEKFGGKYLARGGQITVVSGTWKPARLIIVEFASMDKFHAWWRSPEYRAIAPLREQSAKTNAIVVEGV